jgi:uncharacterized LabA/DUF88 family protein
VDRVVVLIDNSYLSKILKKFYNEVSINLLLFSDNLCIGCNRIQTYIYDSMPYQSGIPTFDERRRYSRKDKYINAIKKLDRFTVKLGRCQKNKEGEFIQKGVDVEFALDLTELSNSKTIDKAIIVSGDSDFVPAVKRANKLGTITQNVYHPQQFSYHLRDICRENRIIDQQLIDNSLLY